MKLHLGCGSNYLEDYVNVDLPSAKDEKHRNVRVDIESDVIDLNFPADTVEEILSKHLLEHFDRVTALALLVKWHKWLINCGVLTIVTPDFGRCIAEFPTNSTKNQYKLVRHLYGSQEEPWAFHRDGWWKEKFEEILLGVGYKNLKFSYQEYEGLYNIGVVCEKDSNITSLEQNKCIEGILRRSVVNDSATAKELVHIYLEKYYALIK